MADSVRLIKKYPNRRLYDTQTSSYITLADVKDLVQKQEEFQVVDAKTSEDLTRQILLQIILDEESAGAPMFSHDVLTQFIRFYGNAMQGMMAATWSGTSKRFSRFRSPCRTSPSSSTAIRRRRPSCGRSSCRSRAGDAEPDVDLHGAEQEHVPPDAGAVAEPDADMFSASPSPARRRPATRREVGDGKPDSKT